MHMSYFMKKYILILFIFNFLISIVKAQPNEKHVELVLGKSVHIESNGQRFSINTSVTRWKSKVVVRIASAGEIRDSSLVLHVVLPAVNGYDYDLADLISQDKDESLEAKTVISFPAIRRTDGTYAFAVPLIQTLSNYPQRKEIYISFKE